MMSVAYVMARVLVGMHVIVVVTWQMSVAGGVVRAAAVPRPAGLRCGVGGGGERRTGGRGAGGGAGGAGPGAAAGGGPAGGPGGGGRGA